MALEPKFEFIDDLNPNNPNSSPDTLAQADDHMRGTKNATKGSFPNLGQAAVTKTAAEINDLVDKSTTQTITGAKTFTDLTGDITGDLTGNADTATVASTITGQGALATLNSVAAAQIDANAVGSSEIATDAVGSSEIAANAVGSSEIAANAVGSSELKTNTSINSLLSISSAGTVVPAGLYNFASPDTTYSWWVQVFDGATWVGDTGSSWAGGAIFSDGANVRLRHDLSGSVDVRYRALVS